MYLPSKFKVEDLSTLHAAISNAGLAIFITHSDRGLEASHVPLLLEPTEGRFGTLYGHLARAENLGARGLAWDCSRAIP
jgi:transcriptional regulator